MSILIFTVYLLIFSFLITRISFFKKSGLNNYWLVGLFLLKIAAGIAYGLFYSQPQYAQGSDTWRFFAASKNETDWLLRDPFGFIKDLFTSGYGESGNLFNASNSYWNDLKSNVIIKLMAACNVLTLKNYYTNIIFFNFFFFFGPVAFYRIIKEKIQANKLILIAFVFCIPSFLFWCSGLHKDGFIFMAVALIFFHVNRWLKEKRAPVGSMLICIFFAILIFALRNFVLLLMLPAVLTWLLCERFPSKKLIMVISVYGICLAIFFISPLLAPGLNFPAYIVSKQAEFKALGGNSQISLPLLEPSFSSFVKFFPLASDIAFFRPHLTETSNLAYWPSIGENILLYLLIGHAIFSGLRNRSHNQFSSSAESLIICCYCFAISCLLLSGYTVTLTGAIVRYRSFVLPFLITPLAGFIQINKK